MSDKMQIGGVALQSPILPKADEAPKAAKLLFETLCTSYRIDLKIATFLVEDAGLETLEDFTTFLTGPEQVETRITDKISGLDKPGLMASRIRQAWDSARLASEKSEVQKRKGVSAEDLDELLGNEVLLTMQQKFWNRHKLAWGVRTEPSDFLVSRLAKEISRRSLTVQEVFKVKTQAGSQKLLPKRQRLTESIALLTDKDVDDDDVVRENVTTYTAKHFTLMLAYARAGIEAVEPVPSSPETSGSDSCLYVQIPLDVVVAYHERLQYCATLLPVKKALPWLRQRDEDERAMWVERYRRGPETLGSIIKKLYETRAAVWEVPNELRGEADTPERSSSGGLTGGPNLPGSSRQPANPKSGGGGGKGPKAAPPPPVLQPDAKRVRTLKTADRLKSGESLCRKWNQGGCSEPCPNNREHRCNAVCKKGGRICGMRNHRSIHCRGALYE